MKPTVRQKAHLMDTAARGEFVLASFEAASIGLYGKLLSDLTKEQDDTLNDMSLDDVQKHAAEVMESMGLNPTNAPS